MRIHFIAIGGSVMHQLAIALHKKGHHISGSDDEIFNPARDNLAQYALLPATEGWNDEKITGDIEAVILGMHAKPNNPELLKAQSLQIPIYSYPQYIYELAKNKIRLVVGGSHGKTTITAMIMHVLRYWNYDFDYLVGARLAGFDSSVRLTDEAPIMVIEGDEYLSSPIDLRPKFHFYKPNFAVLTGIAWDHINVFPTFENYLSQFEVFVNTLPEGGILAYYEPDSHLQELVKEAKQVTLLPYNTHPYENKGDYLSLVTANGGVDVQIFGEHNLQNLSGAMLLCKQLGLTDEQFYTAIAQFKGAAKRLELLGKNETTAVYKDFAHAPSKVTATTKAMQQLQPDKKLVACFELHTYSSLNKQFLPQYAHSLAPANEAVVFFNAHTFAIKKLPMLDKNTVKAYFKHPNLTIFTDKNELEAYLKGINYNNTNLLMMSSGNFGGINLNDITNFALNKGSSKR